MPNSRRIHDGCNYSNAKSQIHLSDEKTKTHFSILITKLSKTLTKLQVSNTDSDT